MKSLGYSLAAAVLVGILFPGAARCDTEKRWAEITGPIGASQEITCIESAAGTDAIYVGSTGGVYVSHDLGKTWARENVSSLGPRVSGIAVSGERVFVSSDEGLYIKEGKDSSWRHIEGENDLLGVRTCADNAEVITWNSERVFKVTGGSFSEISPGAVEGKIAKVNCSNGILYISRDGEILMGRSGSDSWDRITLVTGSGEELPEEIENGSVDEAGNEDEEAAPSVGIRDITSIDTGGACVSTEKGIYLLYGVSGTPMLIDTTGLPSYDVVTAIALEEGVVAATSKKVFFRPAGTLLWKPVLEVSDGGMVKEIKKHSSGDGKAYILAAYSRKIYIAQCFPGSANALDVPAELTVFDGRFLVGPDIKDVHKMAIEYAEVSPDKIEAWRKAAKWRAVLPRLALGYDEDRSDNIEIYTSATQKYLVTGPREKRDGWDISLTWELPDLIWTSAQTSIDVRSKLMVQLRDDILEDVTRLYFERKRLIAEMSMLDEKDKAKAISRQNRIEELTAYIDAYTGGMFSRILDSRSGV